MTGRDIFTVVFLQVTALVLIAGSTVIAHPLLSPVQFVLGVWFAVAGAIAGWQAARK